MVRLDYLIRLRAKAFGDFHRNYYLKKHTGHFDGYDIWVNFSSRI